MEPALIANEAISGLGLKWGGGGGGGGRPAARWGVGGRGCQPQAHMELMHGDLRCVVNCQCCTER